MIPYDSHFQAFSVTSHQNHPVFFLLASQQRSLFSWPKWQIPVPPIVQGFLTAVAMLYHSSWILFMDKSWKNWSYKQSPCSIINVGNIVNVKVICHFSRGCNGTRPEHVKETTLSCRYLGKFDATSIYLNLWHWLHILELLIHLDKILQVNQLEKIQTIPFNQSE